MNTARHIAFAVGSLLLSASPLLAQDDCVARLRVIGVAENDVLNVREYPTAEARIVGIIPPDTENLCYLGDRDGRWIFVRYRRVEGWVNSAFTERTRPPFRRGRDLDDPEEEGRD